MGVCCSGTMAGGRQGCAVRAVPLGLCPQGCAIPVPHRAPARSFLAAPQPGRGRGHLRGHPGGAEGQKAEPEERGGWKRAERRCRPGRGSAVPRTRCSAHGPSPGLCRSGAGTSCGDRGCGGSGAAPRLSPPPTPLRHGAAGSRPRGRRPPVLSSGPAVLLCVAAPVPGRSAGDGGEEKAVPPPASPLPVKAHTDPLGPGLSAGCAHRSRLPGSGGSISFGTTNAPSPLLSIRTRSIADSEHRGGHGRPHRGGS